MLATDHLHKDEIWGIGQRHSTTTSKRHSLALALLVCLLAHSSPVRAAEVGPRGACEDGATRGERRWASEKGPRGVRKDGAMRGMHENGATRDARRWDHGGCEKMRGTRRQRRKDGHEGAKMNGGRTTTDRRTDSQVILNG